MTATLDDDLTASDLFCGGGGSSIGAENAGMRIVQAANHWDKAIAVHQSHFPEARHDCADISRADPRRYVRTRILIASPECTNHSQARGVSRKKQQPGFWDAPDPAAERSRATMWDVPRFAEQMHYDAIIVENVVEATKWVMWDAWCMALTALGYERHLLSHNSMFHGVAQSRDRIYVVWTKKGIQIDLEMETPGFCLKCNSVKPSRQAWKNNRRSGRYGQQWYWSCVECGTETLPPTLGADSFIDFDLPVPKIGERSRPIKASTRDRVWAGMQRFGWVPITTSGAGNVYETTPGNRARLLTDPVPTQQATGTTALAIPSDFAIHTGHTSDGPDGRIYDLADPVPTVTGSDDRLSLVVPLRNHGAAASLNDPVHAVTAGGNHHALIINNNHANKATSPDEPLSAVTTGNRHALIMRNNTDSGRGEMTTPVTEPVRSLTSKGAQSLLIRSDLTEGERQQIIDDTGLRMFEPYEAARAMAFPEGYIPKDLTKRDQMKLAGNAVTPPVMEFICSRVVEALS